MDFKFNDGGRGKYFAANGVRDCVVRAIAIAAQKDYKEVYDTLTRMFGYSPRNGVLKKDTRLAMEFFGGKWHPCMGVGTGCKVHLDKNDLPSGRIVCKLSKHVVAIIDGVVNDTYDPSRNGTRCVYGYWTFNN